MKQVSLKKRGVLRLAGLSFLFSVILIVFIVSVYLLAQYNFYSSSIEADINDILISVDFSKADRKPDSILKKILNRTGLKEVVITSTDKCEILSTSVAMMNLDPCSKGMGFNNVELVADEVVYTIFYRNNFSSLRSIEKVIREILLVFLFFYVVTFLSLLVFLWSTVLKPFEELRDKIRSDNTIENSFPLELDFLKERFFSLQDTIDKKKIKAMYFDLARSVVHDIRTPLLILEKMVNSMASREFVMEQVNEIKSQIDLLLSANGKSVHSTVDFNKLLNEIKIQNDLLFNMELNFTVIAPQRVSLVLSYEKIKNIFSNAIKNSFEAHSRLVQIDISCDANNRLLKFDFMDDGDGVSNESSQLIFEGGYTSKENGNGIGLSGIRRMLNGVGGDICIHHNENLGKGTLLSITLPYIGDLESTTFVLIENDKYISSLWKSKALKNDIKLLTFLNVDECLFHEESKDLSTVFYIDSSLDGGLRGEVEAKKLYDLGFKNLFLATSYVSYDKKSYPWILDIVDKTPAF